MRFDCAWLQHVAQVQALIDGAARETGRLDVMVNNAGLSYPASIIEGDAEEWRSMLETNILALLVGCQSAVKAMSACNAEGQIVNISSIEARISEPGTVHYSSAKGAIESFTRALAVELGPDGIRVNAVAPGAITVEHNRKLFQTPPSKRQFKTRIPLGGCPGEAIDIARATAFLASPLAGYITGTVLHVDGGWTAW